LKEVNQCSSDRIHSLEKNSGEPPTLVSLH